ncbi:MAG: ASCH domain-containing protein, partial [Halobacteriota archaeon]
MVEIDADALLPNDRVKSAVLDGDVTQLSRGAANRYAEVGDTFDLNGTEFEVTAVDVQTLGE